MVKIPFRWIAALVVAIAAGLPAAAADPDAASQDAQKAPPAQRIAIDPRTGLLAAVPEPPTAAAPSPAVRSAPLAGVRLVSGATRVDLQGRYQMAVVARVDASGAVTTACVPASAPPAKPDSAAAASSEVPREK
jgi:hypothetical protein